MKAPDRMFIYGRSCSAKRSDLPAGSNPIEYIRKGAFPVEETRERIDTLQQNIVDLDTRGRPELNGMLSCLDASLQTYRRILSLLEGEE